MAFRKAGTLLPLEREILDAVAGIGAHGIHGFALAEKLAGERSKRSLTSHGTLYKSLDRLRARGLLMAEWEDADDAVAARRPRRRLYRISPDGAVALREAQLTGHKLWLGEAPA
ncbi:MAG TPA: helix-turn-helix transcriptional regulator [Aeromicrobium sp.]|nr:helix-turn-helix transcriptional regulator [Aeromicrobium sp.]